jgi:hypothetical protein
MKRIELGQTIQILANAGVIAGIVMLALELRQNNELLGVELRANSNERIMGTATIVLENPYLLELLGKDIATLTPTERDALVVLGIRTLSGFESSYRDVALGLADEERLRRSVRALWDRPRLNYGMPLAWETFKLRAEPDFVAWMEKNIVSREVLSP